jgi:ADP-ribose pyrophosphatase YjhB (NUDIX family)
MVPAAARRVSRVVLLDPAERILLIHGFDPPDTSLTWWITPGGGVEAGESLADAARREVAEETGITGFELGPVVWRRYAAFDFAGKRVVSDEWHHLGRTGTTETDTSGRTALERATTTGVRWWSAAELLDTRELVYPEGLGRLLTALVEDGPPAVPLMLDPQIE